MSLSKHYRKVPPQLSDDELLSLTTRVLKQCGVENQTQAQFTYEICLEILQRSSFLLKGQISSQNNSKNFLTNQAKKASKNSLISSKTSNNFELSPFYSLQPKPKIRKNSIPWNQAYSIAISFLKEFGMHTTLATVEIEFKYSPEKNIVYTKPQKSLFLTNNDINDDYDSDSENIGNIPGEDTSFMENLRASEYLSYLQRINDSIYNITGNYSYLTSRGKQYQSKNSTRNSSYLDNSNSSPRNIFPATFKEKVKDFVIRQNLSLSSKSKGSNNFSAVSMSEVILDNGSYIKDYAIKDDNKLRYADSANRLKEMANNYSMKKIKNSNNEIEIDIEFENEDDNATTNSLNFSSNSRALKNQNKSKFSKFKK